MLPTVTFTDLLSIFVGGVVVGILACAYATHKVKKFFKVKST